VDPPKKGGGLSQTDLQQLAGPRMSSQRGDKGGVLTRWVPTNLLEAIPPFLPDPAPHEGEWEPAVTVDGQPVVQVAKLRSDPEHTSYLSAVAWIDQKHARFVLHPGSQEPGGGGWSQPDHLPVEQRPGLIAAWNGAFRITNGDAEGGFYLDGRTVAGLRDGQASEVIKRDGSIAIGQWGRDVTMTPDVVGVRQNLVLLVDNGQVVPAVDSSDHNLWASPSTIATSSGAPASVSPRTETSSTPWALRCPCAPSPNCCTVRARCGRWSSTSTPSGSRS